MTKQAKQQKMVIGHQTVLIDLAKSVSRKNNNGSDIISTIRNRLGRSKEETLLQIKTLDKLGWLVGNCVR